MSLVSLCVYACIYVCIYVCMRLCLRPRMYQTLLDAFPSLGLPVYAVISCEPYSEPACRDAATALGLQLGSAGFSFKGSYADVKGCYAYSSGKHAGQAFYSTGGTVEEMQAALPTNSYRPANYDCSPGD